MNCNPAKPASLMATGRSPAPKRQRRRRRGHSWSKSKKKSSSPCQLACTQSSKSELRQKFTSEGHPSSPVEVAVNDYEQIDDSEYSGTKKSRKLSEIGNPLSASRETASSEHRPKSSFLLLSGQSTPPNGTVANVDDTVINEEIPSDMLLENNLEELYPLEEHQRKSEASANVININLCIKDINSALNASLECQTTSASRKQVNMSTWANRDSLKNASNTRKLKMREGLEEQEVLQSSIHVASSVQDRERLKAPESCLSDRTRNQTQQQPNTVSEDTTNLNEASNQEIPPVIHPSLELMYNEKGTHATSNLLDKELTTITSICQASQNAAIFAGNNATQEVKTNHLMEEPTQSRELYRQDEDMVNDKQLLLLSSPYAGSCEFTTDNTALKISAATGSSNPSQLAVSQFSDLQVPFVKRLTAIWSIFEDLDVFKKVPQRPHFLPLQEYLPGQREDMALRLMFSFATIAESTGKLSIKDSMEVFENNINKLRHLETYGFTVQHLLHYLNNFLQIKSDYTTNLEEKKKLNIQMFKKNWSLAQIDSSHLEKDKAIAEHEMKLGQLRREVQQIAKEKEDAEAEFSRLLHIFSSVEDACDNEEQQFHSILDELQQKHRTAQVPKLYIVPFQPET